MDPHPTYNTWCGSVYSPNAYDICVEWNEDQWKLFQEYLAKIAIKMKKERKPKSPKSI